MAKVTVATDWLAACAGCHMSLLDIDERIVPLLEQVEFTSSPVSDLKHPPASGVTVGILTGAVSNSHNIEVARQMRSRCKILVAVGDCATFGGIVACRNLVGTEAALRRAYLETESTTDGLIPDSPELGRPLPLVAGIASLVWAKNPRLTAAEVKRILLKPMTCTSSSANCWPGVFRWYCRRNI